MIKKILLSGIWLMSSCLCQEHEHNQTVGLSSITTTTRSYTLNNSRLINILQEISSMMSSSTDVSAITALLQKVNSGITVSDVQLIQQALQQALQILEASHGLNPITAVEYAAIILDTLAQL